MLLIKRSTRWLFFFLWLSVVGGVFTSCRNKPEKVDLKWPEMTQTTHPWARWWWMGNAVNTKDLAALMKDYKAHGLGGLEITPIYGVKGEENQFIKYLSPEWMDLFQFTLDEAKKLNLGIDMDNTAGWPFGGPWVTPSDESKTVFHKIYKLKGGEKLQKPVRYEQKAMARAVGHRISINEIKQPLSANNDLQKMALSQVVFPKELPLKALVAYSDNGKIVKLKDKVDAEGNLNWTAPEGTWRLYAVFEGWHGKMVERAAPGGEGFVIDPFSQNALNDYLKPFDSAFKGHNIRYLRAVFNDSYEVDDAAGEADWTPRFFADFKKLRGYDLRDHLPALFGKSSTEENERVIADYRQTISDLLLNKFTISWREWAHKKDAITRNQAHGSPANILDLYAASDIPETEGYDPVKIKFASSAGHVAGKPLISSESCTWMNEHFLGTLAEAKQTVNRFLLNGVNHIFYHGTAYSPPDAPWPGWLFYAAVDFNPSNSFWDDFTALNTYVSRVQSFLQKGKPDNDILVYYPIFDYWSRPGRHLLEHFDGSGSGRRNSDFFILVDSLMQQGYTLDFISDRQLEQTKSENGKVMTNGVDYKTIVVPECEYMPLNTFKKLEEMANNGAKIIVHTALPEKVPGLANIEKRRDAFKKAVSRIKFKATDHSGLKKATMGNGFFLLGNNMQSLLSTAGIQRETMVDDSLRFVRRSTSQGEYYFIVNKSSHPVSEWIPIQKSGESVAVFNPQTGIFGMGRQRRTDDTNEVFLQLKPGEACLLNVFHVPVSYALSYPYYEPAGEPLSLSGTWNVKFIKGGPTLPKQTSVSKLTSWTQFSTPGVKAFSGTARYTLSFKKPQIHAGAWSLDLGQVHQSARVQLNGVYLDTIIAAPYQINISDSILKPENTLVIEVSNLMANRIAYMDKKDIQWKKYYNVNFAAKLKENRNEKGLFDASKWEPRSSGLLGPVQLIPLDRKVFK